MLERRTGDARGGAGGVVPVGADQGAVEDHVGVPAALAAIRALCSDGRRAASTLMATSR